MFRRFHRTSQELPPEGSARAARHPLTLAAAAVALLCAAGPGTAAAWNSSAPLGSPVITAAGGVTAELTGFADLTHTFTKNSLSETSLMRLRNLGDVAGDYSTAVTLSPDSSPALAAGVDITVWRVSSPSQCTPTSTPSSPASVGRWDTPPALTGRLEPGASVSYCIRTTLERRNLTNTKASVTPSLAATLTVPGTGWQSTAIATATQSVTGG